MRGAGRQKVIEWLWRVSPETKSGERIEWGWWVSESHWGASQWERIKGVRGSQKWVKGEECEIMCGLNSLSQGEWLWFASACVTGSVLENLLASSQLWDPLRLLLRIMFARQLIVQNFGKLIVGMIQCWHIDATVVWLYSTQVCIILLQDFKNSLPVDRNI